MADISFTWKIVSIDESTGTMVVVYSRGADYEAYAVNIPKPTVNIAVEDHIKKYAPLWHWDSQEAPYAPVQVGQEGTSTIVPTTPAATATTE